MSHPPATLKPPIKSLTKSLLEVSLASPRPPPVALAASQPSDEGDDDDAVLDAPPSTDLMMLRTFDRFWVERRSIMYNAGYKKIWNAETKSYTRHKLKKSAIPLILRDMAPPDGSIFDPRVAWASEKPLFLSREANLAAPALPAAAAAAVPKKEKKKKALSKKELMMAENSKRLEKKSHEKDAEKMANNKSMSSLQSASTTTTIGKLQRMLKMLSIAVQDIKGGKASASQEEMFDILWALEELPVFKSAGEELEREKRAKKEEKKKAKEGAPAGGKKVSKKEARGDARESLSSEAEALKALYDAHDYRDAVKYARKVLAAVPDIVSYQLRSMHDRLEPLSQYNRKFQLEDWQCRVLNAIDEGRSTVVCAPTSSGKTLLSTYTCAHVGSDKCVLFVLPTEVLVWQVAATYFKFFEGNVSMCTESIAFQEVTGEAQVYIGTPHALESWLTKARGCAGQEMVNGRREFSILDGGFKFDYLVLDEVHTLDGPEGDALQRIIKACSCPILALSATIGNPDQLRDWFQVVRDEQVSVVSAPQAPSPAVRDEQVAQAPSPVLLANHYARFINLQRYVSVSSGPDTVKLIRLHPVAAMTRARMLGDKTLIDALALTPVDLIDLFERMHSVFPNEIAAADHPGSFFSPSGSSDEKRDNVDLRITLMQTREYESRLKSTLARLAVEQPDKYDQLQASFAPPASLEKIGASAITGQLYSAIDQLREKELLPAVAFQLTMFGAFAMFKTLLTSLEVAQKERYPTYVSDLVALAKEKALLRKVAAGRADRANAAEDEDNAQAGFEEDLATVDVLQPHPKFVLSPPNSHLKSQEVEDLRDVLQKAGEELPPNHALIRGLRRGIAIYTNEPGFSCYRRQVQILAQKGKIAVVFSDEALAYGVNMPFRSCVFCGDMGDALTPLIAQQMQGRAGRRGMDVQGNIVYLGMDWPVIENLMIAGRTLSEFCDGAPSSDYHAKSVAVVEHLGYACETASGFRLAMDHNVVSTVWELGLLHLPEATALVACLPALYRHFVANNKRSADNIGDQNAVGACLVQIADRNEHLPDSGLPDLRSYLRADEVGPSQVIYEDIELALADHRAAISGWEDVDERTKGQLQLATDGGSLCSGIYDILASKRKGFADGVSFERRNELKVRLFRFGEIVRCVNNTIQQPHGKYRELHKYFNKLFSMVKYSLADMVQQLTDLDDASL
ncbi:hypothetical protein TeGR_g10093 [Tetraparma gracilis]|uniref:Helicase ATP-binding domain-containing protein n=1 Tax=Tetraparma gracilis TaxID=2962635 RepID=A0ABQ6MGY2_9STRA|nr:hypothetical protein TeGR_g10093 [Tetraparma gracilis]